MTLSTTLAAGFAAIVLTGCTTLSGGGLVVGQAGPRKATSLAHKASPTFGRGLSGREWRRLARAEIRALDFVAGGKSQVWGQPSARARGRVEVSQPFSIATRECRRFRHVIVVRAREEAVTGVACREDKGPWSLVS